jgi:hypothetical protein
VQAGLEPTLLLIVHKIASEKTDLMTKANRLLEDAEIVASWHFE